MWRRIFPGGSTMPANPVSLLAFAQMTDMQIVDDKSPMRVEFLDRQANGNDGGPEDSPFDSAYRAQEMLATHLTDAMCRAIRNVGHAPATGLPLQFTILTGDAIDNAQQNEARNYITLLDGGLVSPRSGSEAEDSVGNFGGQLDCSYWKPTDDPIWDPANWYQQQDFPKVPALFPDCRQAFWSTGLGMPWYANIGNHDVKVQGNLPIDALDHWYNLDITLNQRATGGRKILEMDDPTRFSGGTWDSIVMDWDLAMNNNTSRAVAADPDRRLLTKRDFIAMHFQTTGLPVGHGFREGSDEGYYVMPASPDSPFRFISLDTTLAGETHAAGLTSTQVTWLQNTLKSFSSHYRQSCPTCGYGGPNLVYQPGVEDRLIVVYFHDALESMGNQGVWLEHLLLAFPNVIMVVDGHTHSNVITPHFIDYDEATNRNGFWEITTASTVDWPVQSRLIEIGFGTGTPGLNTGNEGVGNGMLSIFTTMLDADAPLAFGGDTGTPARLASLGRQLAANDPQEVSRGIDRRRGVTPSGRNTQLLVPAPFPLHLATPDPVADRSGSDMVGDTVSGGFSARAGAPPYTWSASGLPDGLSFNPVTGRYGGTLTRAGTFTVTFSVSDRSGSLASSTFHWSVNELLSALPVANRLDVERSSVRAQFSAAGGFPPYRWSATGLPPGIALDPSSGVYAGTVPSTAALHVFPVSYAATDSLGHVVRGMFSWWVDRTPTSPTCTRTFDWGDRFECEESCPHECGNYGLTCATCDASGVACCN
jgi:metallophosphoesterase (TIGR03767 family)